MPRLVDISESCLWCFELNSDYGILNNLSKSRIREDLKHRHWEDMIRAAGVLKIYKIIMGNQPC
ncbi:transposase [Bacillus cereus]|nr:transposase [Bacillus cereus]